MITAADITVSDPTFCCPLIGVYPCERERRGCYCHELHLINQHRETRIALTSQQREAAP